MSCHPPTRQVGPYQSEDGPHDKPIQQLTPADLHGKPYPERHLKVYADTPVTIVSLAGRRAAGGRPLAGLEVVEKLLTSISFNRPPMRS